MDQASYGLYKGAEVSFFRIIMPNYNNSEWLDKSIGSVLNQTFTDYHFIFIDDCSTDDSLVKAQKMMLQNSDIYTSWTKTFDKRWNGGSRNVGIRYNYPLDESKYTLFLDSDDWFIDSGVLQRLHDFIEDEECPDCVRLPYIADFGDGKTINMILSDNSVERLVDSDIVACWTKCVKSELVQPFPENTLMEDIVQHIAQCDVIKRVEAFTSPVVVYNRANANSLSENGSKNKKWQSSMYRFVADLADLELKTDICKQNRDKRLENTIKTLKNS